MIANIKHKLTPDDIINAYKEGYFPMADSKDGEIFWHNPDLRAIFPIYSMRMPRSLRQSLKKRKFEFRINTAFYEVITYCGDREDTWINKDIIELYTELNRMGVAHSVETYENGILVGGLYGLAIGGGFFGESMFSKVPDASKAALYYLVERLKERKFLLLDSQYLYYHTMNLGAIEIPKALYLMMLTKALELDCRFE